jgi:hypothetical protein
MSMDKFKVYFYVLALTLLFTGAAGAKPNAKIYGLV